MESSKATLLHCPVRGALNASSLAKDGFTPTEEARRIDFIKFLLRRKYPKTHISVETVVLRGLGEKGRNKLRADVIVYDMPVMRAKKIEQNDRLNHAILVAEIKRDSEKKKSGISFQLEPAMRQLPSMNVIGVYWDDINRILFTKRLSEKNNAKILEIDQDNLANLPPFGTLYKAKPITIETLTPPENLVQTLFSLANIMRSHGVNDEQLRYKETVKLILARYCDERAAIASNTKELSLQVYSGGDPEFRRRIDKFYSIASKRYSRAQTLFEPFEISETDDDTLREIISTIQGIDFLSASNETMQQVFMSFVPAVFKKNLDQFFTPMTLIRTMVEMTQIDPNDKVADPAMGTADFLTAAMDYRATFGDSDIFQRVFGMDSDIKAYELAIINMILNRDGQANLLNADSIERHDLWAEEIGVALCNPPFGANTLEKRINVLEHYDLAYRWQFDNKKQRWVKTEELQPQQQLGILFLERCWKLLTEGGRMAIILPEGYLCTTSYGYVRQWLLDHFQILSIVELPRRIFLKSDADLRSNILVGKKLAPRELRKMIKKNYPIHCELVRNVGYKLGKGFRPIPKQDSKTGLELRDDQNRLVLDSDFDNVLNGFRNFMAWSSTNRNNKSGVARYLDIINHSDLDLKPRRLMSKALRNIKKIKSGRHKRLDEIADVVVETVDIIDVYGPEKYKSLVEGQDIRAIEGLVIPKEEERCWQIADRKSAKVFNLQNRDIIVGLVRPERRNIGMLLSEQNNLVGSPDGIAVVRIKDEYKNEYPQEWIFATLRSEICRIQFWTESGGTSYGKLSNEQICAVLLPLGSLAQRKKIAQKVMNWALDVEDGLRLWETIGSKADRKPILNSPMFGLESDADFWRE